MNVAQIILAQLGGNRFIAMTGAKDFLRGENYLTFGYSSRGTKNKSNKIRITLENNDTYSVKFYNIRGIKVKEVGEFDNIYNNQLQSLFTRETGLDTHL